ncbi:MAG TPA: 3-hydroxyacyl-CoA dehydrogenase family protein [Candidatus Limnocylindrales bacterium]|nr:3-hydroxyacyl-CoA dehydrogenase family protein [Candidatus Limnocylindrales bacterium]
MTKSSVAIIGKNRLAEELLASCSVKELEATQLTDATAVSSTTHFVIDTESGAEDKKRAVLQRLDASLPASAVIVSACLRFTATQMGSWIKKPERLVGFATFYPLKDRKLIEVAAGLLTTETSIEQTEQLFNSLDKATVRVKDAPGLTFPRILSLIINEAARSLEERVASAAEIDVAMRLGVNYPQGPLKWADQIGLDEVLAVLEGLQRETGDDRYRPAPLLKKLVIAGFLGETSGRGFYSYKEGQVKP